MSLIKQILDSNSSLKSLIAEHVRIKTLDKIFKSLLEPNLAEHCRLIKIIEEKMEILVAVDNASWATRLKYETPDIIKILNKQKEFANLNKIKCLILEQEEKREVKNQKQNLSEENEKRWQEIRKKLKKQSFI